MIRGISFKISQLTENILYQIFGNIDVNKYNWYNIEGQNEVWDRGMNKVLFDRKFYDGKDMSECIKIKHYIIFLKLQAYDEYGEYYDIHSYEEFKKSDCKMLLLINDCEFVEIYSKESEIIEIIYNNALINNFKNIQYITDYNDKRKKMDVL